MNNTPDAPAPNIFSGPPPPQEGNGLAVASLVLGILSFFSCGPLFSIPAIILGHVSLDRIRRGVMPPDSRGFATAGTFMGYANLALFIFVFILFSLLVAIGYGQTKVSPFIYTR